MNLKLGADVVVITSDSAFSESSLSPKIDPPVKVVSESPKRVCFTYLVLF